MIKQTLSEIVQAIGGRPVGELPRVSVGGVSTDSRSANANDLFFALRGPRFDGHDFVADALRRGVVAAVVETRGLQPVVERIRDAELNLPASAVLIEVPDALVALGRLAAYYRKQLAANVIAVVGSNGKTTTKAMIHHILSGRLRGRSSPKSFNNAIGVPLTLLSAEHGDEYLVVEVGTNAPGEIAALGAIVKPDAVVLTCLGEEHLEGLGSLEGVAAEECAIFAHVQPNGFAAVNIESPLVRGHLPGIGVRVTTFGRCPEADVRLTDIAYAAPWLYFRLNERFPFRLRLVGEHNAINAAGAVTVARRLGYDYGEAAVRLESFELPPMRNEILEIAGVTILNDAYNANPQSAVAAIDAFQQLPCRGQRIVVFGEMRELGSMSIELHRRVAEKLRDSDVQRILLLGQATSVMFDALRARGLFGPAVEQYDNVKECAQRLATVVEPGDVVLLKASRAVGLEQVVEPLRQSLEAAHARGA